MLYGSGRARTGYSSMTWGLGALALAIGAVALAFAGVWWLSVLAWPLIGYSIARTIGTYREGYRW